MFSAVSHGTWRWITEKNKQQIDRLKSLICRSGVSSRHRSLLASYESANRLPDNVSSVHTLSAGFSITQIRRVSAAESQRPHNESNKRLTIFEWGPPSDCSCACDYVFIGNTIGELEHLRRQLAVFIELPIQRITKTKFAQQKPSAMVSELCRVVGKQRKEAQICFRVLLTKRVTYSDESGPQAAQVQHYCRRVPDTLPCHN